VSKTAKGRLPPSDFIWPFFGERLNDDGGRRKGKELKANAKLVRTLAKVAISPKAHNKERPLRQLVHHLKIPVIVASKP